MLIINKSSIRNKCFLYISEIALNINISCKNINTDTPASIAAKMENKLIDIPKYKYNEIVFILLNPSNFLFFTSKILIIIETTKNIIANIKNTKYIYILTF